MGSMSFAWAADAAGVVRTFFLFGNPVGICMRVIYDWSSAIGEIKVLGNKTQNRGEGKNEDRPFSALQVRCRAERAIQWKRH